MVSLPLFILPGAFHSPVSYQLLVKALKSHPFITKHKHHIECIDYQRLKYLKQNEMPTVNTYINESVKIIKLKFNNFCSLTNDKCLMYLIGHSMGSRICQMVISKLLKCEGFKLNEIGGMIHLCGTLFQNGQTYIELSEKHRKIVGKTKFANLPSIKSFNQKNENECWMKFENMEFAKYSFLNDMDSMKDEKTINWYLNSLQPEISSNATHKVVYDADMVNAKNIRNLYILNSNDNCIHISLQTEMCDAFGLDEKDRIVMNAGHCPFVSKPDLLCDHICGWIQRELEMGDSKL